MAVVALAHSRSAAPEALARLLNEDGYELFTVPVRRTLVDQLADAAPDVVVVDGSLDDFDVVRVCRDIRRSVTSRIVVIPATSAGEAWVLDALRAGADDVLDPNASEAMVRTRMMAIVRGGPPHQRESGQLVVGDIVVDLDGHTVLVGGDIVRFPVRLFRTLVELARRPNTVVTCEQLLQEVWGVEPEPSHRKRVRVAVSALRRLLGDGAYRPRIETVVRVGYRLATVAAPSAAIAATASAGG